MVTSNQELFNPPITSIGIEKFHSRLRNFSDGCVAYGNYSSLDSPKFWWEGKAYCASRVAYFIVNGPFPKKLKVLHSCNNAHCVNHEHIYLGTTVGRWYSD